MIQLLFDADDAEEALTEDPVSVGYSQHEGAEAADWGDEKLELVDGRRPVVYPAAGSHANFFDPALYVGSSGEQGVGCDDTRGPHLELEPKVITIPSESAGAAPPWLTFEGRWGELQDAFFNGPTGPNMKTQWTEPVTWSEGWRPRAYAVPTSGLFGTGATDFFCQAVETGSRGLVKFLRDPGLTLLVLSVIVGLAWFGIARTTWHPIAPLRLARRRSWGQVLSASGRMYVKRARLFLGIGLLLIPLGVVISILQALVLGGFGLLGVDTTGEGAGALVLLLVAIGLTLTLLGLALVQAATACALIRIDAGEEIGPVEAVSPGAGARPSAAARSRHRGRRLGRAHCDGDPDPGRDLARGAVVAAGTGRGDRGPSRRSTRSGAAASSSAGTGCASPRSSASARSSPWSQARFSAPC